MLRRAERPASSQARTTAPQAGRASALAVPGTGSAEGGGQRRRRWPGRALAGGDGALAPVGEPHRDAPLANPNRRAGRGGGNDEFRPPHLHVQIGRGHREGFADETVGDGGVERPARRAAPPRRAGRAAQPEARRPVNPQRRAAIEAQLRLGRGREHHVSIRGQARRRGLRAPINRQRARHARERGVSVLGRSGRSGRGAGRETWGRSPQREHDRRGADQSERRNEETQPPSRSWRRRRHRLGGDQPLDLDLHPSNAHRVRRRPARGRASSGRRRARTRRGSGSRRTPRCARVDERWRPGRAFRPPRRPDALRPPRSSRLASRAEPVGQLRPALASPLDVAAGIVHANLHRADRGVEDRRHLFHRMPFEHVEDEGGPALGAHLGQQALERPRSPRAPPQSVRGRALRSACSAVSSSGNARGGRRRVPCMVTRTVIRVSQVEKSASPRKSGSDRNASTKAAWTKSSTSGPGPASRRTTRWTRPTGKCGRARGTRPDRAAARGRPGR